MESLKTVLIPSQEKLFNFSYTFTTFHILTFFLVITTILWFCQFHWRRRKLYQIAKEIPGPVPWPFIGSSYRFLGDASYIYNSVMSIFATYGELFAVWHGPTLVCGIAKPEYLEKILNSPKSMHKMYLYKYAEVMVGQGLFTAPVSQWKRHRKIIMPTFNQKILDGFVAIFAEQCQVLVQNLTKLVGQGEFDIFHSIAKCTLDIICETAMGVKVGAQSGNCEFAMWVDRLLEISFLRMFVISYHFDMIFKFTKLHQDQQKYAEKFHSFINRVIYDKKLDYSHTKFSNRKRRAFLELLIENNCFTDEELKDEVNTFMIAGSDTTASSISFLFCLLGMHPEIQDKIYEEVMDVLNDKLIESEDLPRLKYTEAVVKESLRLFPVGAFIVRDVYEDLELDKNVTIPGGSSAILGIMPVHRNEKYWKNPLKFDPDRFLDEETCSQRHPYAYLPFSRGPRNCVGVKYGMMAMKAMVATLVREFKFETSYKSVEDIKLKTNLVVRPVNGFKIVLMKR